MAFFRERSFDMPWRTVYESHALVWWCICTLITLFYLLAYNLPKLPTISCLFFSSIFIGWRLRDSLRLWSLKLALLGKGLLLESTLTSIQHQKDNPTCFLGGYGFDWKLEHTQRLYDLKRIDVSLITPPDWYIKLRGQVREQSNYHRDVGSPYIHGVEVNEKLILVPLTHMQGHTCIFGITGSGKTRLFEYIVSQAIWRGDVVIVIDPKGDVELRERMRQECIRTPGRADHFAMFHPAFPTQSVCFDAMANFNRTTELASRISSLLPAESPNDPFVSFNWRVANIISQSLLSIDQRPNLKKLRKFVEGGTDQLVENCLLHHFAKNGVEGWETQIAQFKLRAAEGEFAKPTKTTRDELVAYIEFYKQEVAHYAPEEAIEGLVNMFFHDRTHLSKMITTLIPALDMLTSSDLGPMLSPDSSDLNETRDILHMSKIIDTNKVFYMGLDALSDPIVCNAIATIAVADLAASAGQIYNYQSDRPKKRITFLIDEASAALSPPFIEIANKGRGAGIEMTMATQVLSDVQARLGSEERARQVLGNFNNLIALRTNDGTTQEYILERFGKNYVGSLQYSIGTSGNSANSISEFQGNEGVRQSDELIETIPPDILGQLQNFHYFASFSGGRIVKGRIPIMTDKKEEK